MFLSCDLKIVNKCVKLQFWQEHNFTACKNLLTLCGFSTTNLVIVSKLNLCDVIDLFVIEVFVIKVKVCLSLNDDYIVVERSYRSQ